MFDLLPRLKEILIWAGHGPTVFADEIGVARPIISHVFSGRNRVSLDVVQKILSRFPELSPAWLLLGEGEMLKPLGNFEGALDLSRSSVKGQEHDSFDKAEKEGLEEVQISELAGSDELNSLPTPSRQVSRIVIFYSDGFFESFDQMP